MSDDLRLDVALVRRGLASSREKAQTYIMQGIVYLNGKPAKKAGQRIAASAILSITQPTEHFVSRGGCKLQKALDCFALQLTGLVCLDIGASTGGFTDCMLQAGAKHVFALDVGHGQLAKALRNDTRVTNIEGCNFRCAAPELLPCAMDFASMDVSFISLRLLLPALVRVLQDGAYALCLVKPQFEAGRASIGKNGVVKNPVDHLRVLNEICAAALENGLVPQGLTHSPIRGAQGNIEYLLLLQKTNLEWASLPCPFTLKDIVKQAFEEL